MQEFARILCSFTFCFNARPWRDAYSWVTTSVRVLEASGLWEAAATIALLADARGGTISNLFGALHREDVSVNNFCIVEGASVCLLATQDVHFGNLLMFVAVGLHRQSFQFADGSLDVVGKPGMLGDRESSHVATINTQIIVVDLLLWTHPKFDFSACVLANKSLFSLFRPRSASGPL